MARPPRVAQPPDPLVDPSDWRTWTIAILVVATVWAWLRVRKLRSRIFSLRRERETIVVGEHRMFDFLRGLGEKMQTSGAGRSLYRHVVGGVVKVVGAQGGILYLFDAGRGDLAPVFVSPRCPAVLPVPPEVREASGGNPKALRGYLQLRTLSTTLGLAAEVVRQRHAVNLPASEGLATATGSFVLLGRLPLMLGPLFRGEELFGLLAVARQPGDVAFSRHDFAVFKSAVEQSGFALVNALTYQEAAEKKQLVSELRTASEIQRILLPDHDPVVPGFSIRGTNRPARFVSGDYFDYIAVDENRIGIAIADVSGKGVAASLLTAMCRSTLRTAVPLNLSPADVLGRLNRMLYPDIREDMFISMAYLLIDRTSDEVVMARAGHDAPLVYRAAAGTVERLQCPGLAIGIDEGAVFERVTRDFRFRMDPGDCLLLFTDGVNEALDQQGDEFGLDRLKDVLARTAPSGAAAVVETVLEEIGRFVGSHPQSDDITLIAIEKQ